MHSLVIISFDDQIDSKEAFVMVRKMRSDCQVGSFEEKHGLPPGTIRNPDGRDTRSDKKIGTFRKEAVMKSKQKR